MRSVSDKSCRGKQNTHFMFKNLWTGRTRSPFTEIFMNPCSWEMDRGWGMTEMHVILIGRKFGRCNIDVWHWVSTHTRTQTHTTQTHTTQTHHTHQTHTHHTLHTPQPRLSSLQYSTNQSSQGHQNCFPLTAIHLLQLWPYHVPSSPTPTIDCCYATRERERNRWSVPTHFSRHVCLPDQ